MQMLYADKRIGRPLPRERVPRTITLLKAIDVVMVLLISKINAVLKSQHYRRKKKTCKAAYLVKMKCLGHLVHQASV